jgi:hypothetical protein
MDFGAGLGHHLDFCSQGTCHLSNYPGLKSSTCASRSDFRMSYYLNLPTLRNKTGFGSVGAKIGWQISLCAESRSARGIYQLGAQ